MKETTFSSSKKIPKQLLFDPKSNITDKNQDLKPFNKGLRPTSSIPKLSLDISKVLNVKSSAKKPKAVASTRLSSPKDINLVNVKK